MVASDHTRPVARNQRRTTNPIGRERVSGFVQSGFNEIARRAMMPAFPRATSQNPPDSLAPMEAAVSPLPDDVEALKALLVSAL